MFFFQSTSCAQMSAVKTVSRGHLDSVRWLTANGARVSTADDSGRTARDLAGKYQHCAVFDLLTSCEKSYADHHGMSLDGCRAQHRE